MAEAERQRAFRVAYDGRPFHGFQRQPDVPTVEDCLLDAVRALELADDGALPPGWSAAGRTDAGVSALAQTVTFRCPAWCSAAALSGELPADVRVWAAADVPDGFHATHDARTRAYVYFLYAPPDRVDDGLAAAALARLCGEHDFANFTPDTTGTVRTLGGTVVREGAFLVLRFVAGGFARQLVRRLVTVVRSVAAGETSLARLDRLLVPTPVEGPAGVAPAPPTPLVLADVTYPGVSFAVDDGAAASASEVFEARAVDGHVRARVAEALQDGVAADAPPAAGAADASDGPAGSDIDGA